MYLVACKWVSDGVKEYKLPSDYLESSSSTPEEIQWAVAALEYASIVKQSPYYVNYVLLSDPNSKNKISLNYYTDQSGYDTLSSSPQHTQFGTDRGIFLQATGFQLVEKKAFAADLSLLDNKDYAAAEAFVMSV